MRQNYKFTLFKFILITTIVTLFSAVIGLYMGIRLSRWSLVDMLISIMPQNQIQPAENILLLGVDNSIDGTRRSDTIMVINLNRSQNRISILSIPRDTRIELPKVGYTKINHAYAIGDYKLVKSTVSRFLQIPIKYYIVVDLQGVKNIVDQIGGVPVDIKNRLYYVDRAGDLYIDFKPGRQILDGKKTIAYLRYRQYKNGDIGRIKKQQEFVKSLADRIISSKQIVKLPKVIGEMSKYVETNLSIGKMINLALEMNSFFEKGNLKVNTIPGSIVLIDGVSYWKVDLPKAIQLIDETIHGFGISQVNNEQNQEKTQLGLAKKMTLSDVNKFMPKKKVDEIIFDKSITVSVEVLNGNGLPDTGVKVAAQLKKRGVKVPRIDNAGHFNYQHTVLVDWKGKKVETLTLAKALNIDPRNIVTYYKPKKSLDLTLVVGHDWEELEKK